MKASNEGRCDHATLVIRCFDVHGMTASGELATCKVSRHSDVSRPATSEFHYAEAELVASPADERADQSGAFWRSRICAVLHPLPCAGTGDGHEFGRLFDSFRRIKIMTAWKAGISQAMSSDLRPWTVLPLRSMGILRQPAGPTGSGRGLSRCKRPSRQNPSQERILLPSRLIILVSSGIRVRE